jgi:hypothetical protein
MWDRRAQPHKAFARSKRDLVDHIWHLLGMRCEGQHCEHLLGLFGTLQPEDSIVSFNWDTIADYTLELGAAPQYANYVQFMTEPKTTPTRYANRGLLLKLHGSLNWLICASRACPASRRPVLARGSSGRLVDTPTALWTCPLCGGKEIHPFIVPPASNKAISEDSFLRNLWMLALDKLYDVGHIVFIGYSLPPADSHAEWLFRHMHLQTRRKPTITVVDPAIMQKDTAVYRRYHSVFRGFRLRTYPSLQEFAGDFRALSRRRLGKTRRPTPPLAL